MEAFFDALESMNMEDYIHDLPSFMALVSIMKDKFKEEYKLDDAGIRDMSAWTSKMIMDAAKESPTFSDDECKLMEGYINDFDKMMNDEDEEACLRILNMPQEIKRMFLFDGLFSKLKQLKSLYP